MAKSSYKLAQFTAESIAETQKDWRQTLARQPLEFNSSIFERRLELIAQSNDYEQGTEFYYGIFNGSNKAALAVTEISYTRKGSRWIKMLNLHLCPTLDLSIDKNEPMFKELAAIFAAAIVGTIKLTSVHPSRVIKLYARSVALLRFFEFVAEALPFHIEKIGGDASRIKFSIEGRWLVIKL